MASDSPARMVKGECQDGVQQLDPNQRVEADEQAPNGTTVAGEENVIMEVEGVKVVSKGEDEAAVNNSNHGSKKPDANSHHQDSKRERDRGRRRSVSPDGRRKRSASPGKRKLSPSSGKRSTTPLRRRSPSPGDRKRKHRDGTRSVSSSGRSRSRSRSRSRFRSRSRSSSRSRSPPSRSGRALSPYTKDHRERSRSRSPRLHRRSPRGRDYSAGKRYSPRRRSSPRFRGRRGRSPLRRRPWSPPANRSNGVGKPGNNLFIAGFNFITTERDLERKFSRYGRVMDVRIVRDKRSGESRGFGFLTLERDEDADAAIKALDQTEWNGRIVLVEKAKTPTRF